VRRKMKRIEAGGEGGEERGSSSQIAGKGEKTLFIGSPP
jgi:hypothetical protein